MKKEYDFSKAKRGAVLSPIGETRITIYLDDKTIHQFELRSEKWGKDYQTLINESLKAYLNSNEGVLTPGLVLKISREEPASH